MKIIVPKKACPFNNMDGEMSDIEQYEVLNASSDRINSTLIEDTDMADLYSSASGLRAAIDRNRKRRDDKRNQKNKRKNLRVSSKAKARTQRTGAKVAQAKSQSDLAKSLNSGDDTALLTQINQNPATAPKKISVMGWVGIGLGVALLVGGVVYAVSHSHKTVSKAA